MLMISNDRLKHSIEVARLMKKEAEAAGWSAQKCEEMFVLGYLHDIGYEFAERQSDHASIGGELLKKQGYPYWREVACHGKLDVDYDSEELALLNKADMRINSSGQQVSIDMRLQDIGTRYGMESVQYKEAVLFSKKIGLL